MFSFKLFFVSALLINGCISESEFYTQCRVNDNECADKIFTKAADVALNGDESLFIEAVDPLFFDIVEGNLTIVDYKLFNSTLTGLKDCKFSSVRTDFASSKLKLVLECPNESKIVGKFDIRARIYSGVMEGKGDYDFTIGSFKVNLESYFNKKITSDGKVQLIIKNFISKASVKTPPKASFENIVTSDRSKFTTQNWKAFGDILQEPLLFASLKKIFINFNEILKTFELAV